jgi:hypothetical protein
MDWTEAVTDGPAAAQYFICCSKISREVDACPWTTSWIWRGGGVVISVGPIGHRVCRFKIALAGVHLCSCNGSGWEQHQQQGVCSCLVFMTYREGISVSVMKLR